MLNRVLLSLTLILIVLVLHRCSAQAQDPPASSAHSVAAVGEVTPPMVPPREQSTQAGNFGLRAGIGTDLGGGIAYGFGANYLVRMQSSALELGVRLFMGEFEETTEETYTYHETTNILVFGLMADYLIGYHPLESGVFFISGVGVGLIEVEWEERSEDDNSLGTPYGDDGSMQSEDASDGGLILNIGIGFSLSPHFDIRGEIPVFVMFAAPGEASAVIPTFTLTAGVRF